MITLLGIQSTVVLWLHSCVSLATTAMVNFIQAPQRPPELQIRSPLCTLHYQVSLQYGSACLLTIGASDWGMGVMTRRLSDSV